MDADLTPPQAGLLEALRRRIDAGEPSPTYRELCVEFGWASTGTVRDHLHVLARKGYLTLGGGRARQVRLREPHALVRQVPLLGRVVAGVPEGTDATIPVPSTWLDPTPDFAFRVAGDSMSAAAVVEGDIVLLRQIPAAEGDLVVVAVDGEASLRRFQMRPDGGWLVRGNQADTPVGANAAAIVGVVVGLLRGVPEQATLADGRGGEPIPVSTTSRHAGEPK